MQVRLYDCMMDISNIVGNFYAINEGYRLFFVLFCVSFLWNKPSVYGKIILNAMEGIIFGRIRDN